MVCSSHVPYKGCLTNTGGQHYDRHVPLLQQLHGFLEVIREGGHKSIQCAPVLML